MTITSTVAGRDALGWNLSPLRDGNEFIDYTTRIFMNKTSREAAAELQPSAPLGLGYRRVPNPALTRWVILSRRFAALGNGATVETGRIVALAKR